MSSSQHPAAVRTAALLGSLWQRNLPILRDRLAQLDHASALAAEGLLTPAIRHETAATAHKLAGALGMFGYPEGTRLSQELETLLAAPDPLDANDLLRLTRELRSTLNL